MDDIIESGDGADGGRGLVGALLLPVRLVIWLIGLGFRLGWWAAKVPVRVTATTTRVLGPKAVVLFVAGVVLGLLFAPTTGAELRERLRRRLEGGGLTDEELAEKVGFELAHAPRTWHLPQPEVAAAAGTVTLTGEVPHGEGRGELERVAGAVPGVDAVVNALVVNDAIGEQ